MKNKNGFTLVELLAVIAILAILVVMLLPNIIELFQDSKEGAFKVEIQQIMKQAEAQWLLDMGKEQTFYNCMYPSGKTDADPNDLPLQGADYYYKITINAKGEFIEVSIASNDYAYSSKVDGKTTVKALDIIEDDIYGANVSDEDGEYQTRKTRAEWGAESNNDEVDENNPSCADLIK